MRREDFCTDAINKNERAQELKARDISELEAKVEWPARVSDYEEAKGDARKLVHEYGGTDEQQVLSTIIDEGDKAVAAKDARMLERHTTTLRQLCYAMYQRDPGFLGATLAHLVEQEAEFPDRARARALFNDGAMALKRRDIDALKSIIQELYQLLPSDTAEAAKSAIQSDIL